MNPLDLMARTVYGEARGEPQLGQVAVAWVIKNRAAKPGWWGHDIASVCLAHEQFDCWDSNDPNCKIVQAVEPSDPAFARITAVCDDVLNGRISDPTFGATYYYATSMPRPPRWAVGKVPSATLGRQMFFNTVGD